MNFCYKKQEKASPLDDGRLKPVLSRTGQRAGDPEEENGFSPDRMIPGISSIFE
jgi:hypothetical protein